MNDQCEIRSLAHSSFDELFALHKTKKLIKFVKKLAAIIIIGITTVCCNNPTTKIHTTDTSTYLKGPAPGNGEAGKDSSGGSLASKDRTPEDELPYLDREIMGTNGAKGYQDTFSVDNEKFRIIHHDTLYDGIIQKYDNRKWTEIFRFERLGNHNDYYVNKDLNNDGYNDICRERKWDMQTFFYDPKLTSFIVEPIHLPYDWSLIDKKKSLYCNYQQTKTANATSELYYIRNFEKVVISHIEFIATEVDNQVVDKIILYKGKKKVKRLEINKDEEFDYVNWWKENYKQLL